MTPGANEIRGLRKERAGGLAVWAAGKASRLRGADERLTRNAGDVAERLKAAVC
ncbi:MAG: hypothetical protein ACT4OG_09935 [Alphaproteobacteria bacterium]